MGKKSNKGRIISKVKKTNIARNKLVKAGKLKPKSKPNFVEGGQFKKKGSKVNLSADQIQRRQEYDAEKKQKEAEMYQELASMMDPEDVEYLKRNASRSKAFNIKVENQGKRKRQDVQDDPQAEQSDDDEGFEDYEKKAVKRIKAVQDQDLQGGQKRNLLPVRSDQGWEQRTVQVPEMSDPEESDNEATETENKVENDEEKDNEEPVSVIEILAKRKKLIEESKLSIGSMATNFLENPEERLFLLDRLIRYMSLGSNDLSVENTVIKLASASVLEIFKDVLPQYKIADHENQDKNVKLKKDTLKLHRFESTLLNCSKRYLVKLERIVSGQDKTLASHALFCLMDLLKTNPEFNFGENIIQFSVPYLNHNSLKLRSVAAQGLEQVLKNDKRGQVSLYIVRSINHHMKSTRKVIKPEMLNVLLGLKLHRFLDNNPKDIATGHQQNAKKKKREEMSKKERKLAKARAKLDKELLEAKAEESSKTRLRFGTDISNMLFAVYFRLIKDPQAVNKYLLRPVLTGLSKFGHLMSIDYFQDLLRVLSELLDRQDEQDKYYLGSHEALLCIQTVLSILSGQGEALTLDPQKFYHHLERIIECLDDLEDFNLAAQVLHEALIKRRKKISKSVLFNFIKKVGVASLANAEAAPPLTQFLKECIQAHPTSVSVTLMQKDEDVEVQGAWSSSLLPKGGRGMADQVVDLSKDPLIWEVSSGLCQHFNPQVAKNAQQIIGGVCKSEKTPQLRLPQGYSIQEELENPQQNRFVILSVTK